MSVDDVVLKRIDALLKDSIPLKRTGEHGTAFNDEQASQCRGWIAAAMNIVDLVCPNPTAAYRREAERILGSEEVQGYCVPVAVGSLAALLTQLRGDAAEGLLTSLADKARAETFDDFLDHAEAYRKENRKNEASVIAGVVFEDTVRRICRKHGIAENGVKLDQLISELVKGGLLTDLKAKRARASAGLRTSATHARWEQIDEKDIQPTIDLTRELIEAHLDR